MTTATRFSRQNYVGSRSRITKYWENLLLVVVLVLEPKALSNELEVAHPHSGVSSTIHGRIGIWKMLVFDERGNAATNTNVFNPASNLPIPGADVQSAT